MIYKPFGKTGKQVSALGMGVSRFSPAECENPEKREEFAEVLVKAYEKGINYFDVAPTYCGWWAEEILGMALKQIKGEYYVTDKSSSTQDPTADKLRRRLENSLKKDWKSKEEQNIFDNKKTRVTELIFVRLFSLF